METIGGEDSETGLVTKKKAKQKSTTGSLKVPASPRTTGVKNRATYNMFILYWINGTKPKNTVTREHRIGYTKLLDIQICFGRERKVVMYNATLKFNYMLTITNILVIWV